MSKKPLVVKTYGRHKYRTVKAQTWLSPEEVHLSPFEDLAGFPSKFESVPFANIVKPKLSEWNNPAQKTESSLVKPSKSQNGIFKYHSPSRHSDKENCFLRPPNNDPSNGNSLDRRLTRKRQNLFGNCTPVSVQRQQVSTSKFDISEPEVVLANDSLEIKEDNRSNITQGHTCIQDSNKCSLSPNHRPSEHIADLQLSKCNIVHHSSLSSPEESDVASGLENGNYAHFNASKSGFNKWRNSYVTSTPVFDTETSPAINGNSCKSDSQSSILMDGKVVLEPLRITPIQWQKCLSASIETSGSKNSDESITDDFRKLKGSKSSGLTYRRNPSVDLKECVVSLERMRITPLKKKSRYYLDGITASAVSTGNKGKSHLSFVKALTPSKKKQTTCKTAETDEVELSAFDKIMLECDQEEPVKFADFLDSSLLKTCVKIGEGVYGEVFQAQYENGKSIAFKIIPVEGDFEVNCTPQKSFGEILPEIVISKELSLLGELSNEQDHQTMASVSTSFITVHSVTCCRDQYPEYLISEWDKWDKDRNSENDRPDIFPSDQYFIVFEFSNGGRDLESFEFSDLSEAWSVLHQTALGLAVAENALEFEHRDLHWGNVLICRTDEEFVKGCLMGETKMAPTRGVRVSLIDFTLSRLKKDGLTVFCNLAEDESLFGGKGDYQFDVYRLMKKATRNDWEQFEPHTNALWLHYLADKMLKRKKYPNKDKDMEAKLKRFLRQARKCSSATEIVQEFFD